MYQYSWKTTLFNSKTTITRNHKNIGYFSISFFGVTYMEILDQIYRFKITGFSRNTFEMYQSDMASPIAVLIFHTWKRSVTIHYKDTVYQMKYKSIFSSYFRLYQHEKSIYKYHPSFSNGTMENTTDNPILIILGIYAHIRRRRNT